jgi:glycosyltransferase involved in cell wall biosynthesis
MKIAYYMPFKPMGHRHPSGDLVIGTELFNFLHCRHEIELVSRLRCRWIYLRPRMLLQLLTERRRLVRHGGNGSFDLWLSYHSYYKAPDLLGPWCSARLGLPYAIFQGIYSTKRRRRLLTLPGFLLNRKALLAAGHVFTNKKRDLANLRRLLPEKRLSYIAPGLHPDSFSFDGGKRAELRQQWGIDGAETVVMAAAMMRPGVKTSGLMRVLDSCAELRRAGLALRLVVVGDGSCRQLLMDKAAALPPGAVIFVGQLAREAMAGCYSAADLFAFPGIEESLGMVYLEAQSCGLPVVACGDWGGGEAVVDGETGLLVPAAEPARFTQAIRQLVEDAPLRTRLGHAAGEHIRQHHDLDRNYRLMEDTLASLAKK